MKALFPVILLWCCMVAMAKGQTTQRPFSPLDTNYRATVVLSAPSLTQSVLFREGVDWVKQTRLDGYKGIATAPPNHDYMFYIPDAQAPNQRGRLIINHESANMRDIRPALGEGGGMSIVNVERIGNQWRIVTHPLPKDTSVSVDFTPVGWTMINCGGGNLSNGNFLTGEEIFSNVDTKTQAAAIFDTLQQKYGYDGKGFYTIPANVPDFGGRKIPIHHNFGWMTEVDPNAGRAVRKWYHAGRFSHEGGTLLADQRSVILTNDFIPAILFKFVADRPNDFSSGSLFCFKQDRNTYAGRWIPIERNLDSLIQAPRVAMRKGATLFMRMEWSTMDPATGKVYISETGADATVSQATQAFFNGGATIPWHWINDAYDSIRMVNTGGEQRLDMPYGAILVLEGADTDRPSVRPYLKGGFDSKKRFCFTSSDGLAYVRLGNVPYLIVQEDPIGLDRGRIAPSFLSTSYAYALPKAYLLDIRKQNPTPDDLLLMAIGSPGSEFTGGCTTPDGSTLFLVNQHPNATNPAPFNTSAVVALTGFDTTVATAIAVSPDVHLSVFPNPFQQTLFFSKPLDGWLVNAEGKMVTRIANETQVSLYGLPDGVYYVRTVTDGSIKVIKQN